MTDIDYMIDVMTHFKNGGEVEWKIKEVADERDGMTEPLWNWAACNYRKKPEPKKTRQVKLLAWFDGVALHLEIESAPIPHLWKRVPKEDMVIEVEE